VLPKRQRTATRRGRSELSRSVSKHEKKAKLKTFDESESLRTAGERKAMETNYRSALEALKASTLEEAQELKQMQTTKKTTLLGNETAKLSEIEVQHTAETVALTAEFDGREKELESNFQSKLQLQDDFYNPEQVR
jgi:uncharacterized protein YciI